MLDWSFINEALRQDRVSEITYSESEGGKSVIVTFRASSGREVAPEPYVYREPLDPQGPAFREAKTHLQALYSHTGAPVSDDDVLNYLKAQGLG